MKQPPEVPSLLPAAARLVQLLGAAAASLGVLCLCALPAGLTATAQELPEDIADNWYKTEVLVFARVPDTPAQAPGAETIPGAPGEAWDPMPALNYPEQYQFLIDANLAERRLRDSAALGSVIDDRGVQHLELPFPITELLYDDRPDALIAEPPDASIDDAQTGGADPNSPEDPNAPEAPDLLTAPELEELEELVPDPNQPLLVLPYQQLDGAELEFRQQARSLERRGQRVMFHSAWWSRMDEGAETLPIVIDRSGDADMPAWPELQGSLQLYRSRYLHIDVNLWLNTPGNYLPPGWQIESPPLAPPSALGRDPAGQSLPLWADEQIPVQLDDEQSASEGLQSSRWEQTSPPVDNRASRYDALPTVGPDAGLDANRPDNGLATDDRPGSLDDEAIKEDEAFSRPYPWRHAITHRQTRRVRSGEIHYLDHPVIGVIVRVTAVGDEAQPLVSPDSKPQVTAFRDRHALDGIELPEQATPP